MAPPRFANSLRFRLSAAFVLLVVCTVAGLGSVLHRATARELQAGHREYGRALALGLARNAEDGLRQGDRRALLELLGLIGTESRVRYCEIYSAERELLARWWTREGEAPRLAAPSPARPSVQDAWLGDEPITEFDVPVLVRDAAAGRLAAASSPMSYLGTVRIGLSRASLVERTRDALLHTMRLVALAALLGALAALLLVRRFLKPVGALIRATESVGEGGLPDLEPLPRTQDEMGALALSFARMTRRLHAARRDLVGANRDLERKVVERTAELSRALDQLRSLDRMKDDFLSSVSHEFRTPLTAIRSFGEILLSFPDEPEATRREFLATILEHVERLAGMVDDVMDLVQLERDELQLRRTEVDLAELAREAGADMRGALEDKKLRLVIHRHEDAPCADGDPLRLRQVLRNLLSNAIKFSPPGGRIEVEVVARDEAGERRAEARVTDQGHGIPPSELETIFERFRQLGDTLTEKPRGAGLGLPICRGIVERHGGRIRVDSTPGRGSTFSITLPAWTHAPAAAGAYSRAAR